MSAKTVCNPNRMSVERMAARALVVTGGIFWMVAAFAGPYFFENSGMGSAVGSAIYPFAATVGTLVVCWVYERLAAVLLLAGAAGVVVWGVLFGWETGLWVLMSAVLIAPITLAAVLFMLASRMEDMCALEERTVESGRIERSVSSPSHTQA